MKTSKFEKIENLKDKTIKMSKDFMVGFTNMQNIISSFLLVHILVLPYFWLSKIFAENFFKIIINCLPFKDKKDNLKIVNFVLNMTYYRNGFISYFFFVYWAYYLANTSRLGFINGFIIPYFLFIIALRIKSDYMYPYKFITYIASLIPLAIVFLGFTDGRTTPEYPHEETLLYSYMAFFWILLITKIIILVFYISHREPSYKIWRKCGFFIGIFSLPFAMYGAFCLLESTSFPFTIENKIVIFWTLIFCLLVVAPLCAGGFGVLRKYLATSGDQPDFIAEQNSIENDIVIDIWFKNWLFHAFFSFMFYSAIIKLICSIF